MFPLMRIFCHVSGSYIHCWLLLVVQMVSADTFWVKEVPGVRGAVSEEARKFTQLVKLIHQHFSEEHIPGIRPEPLTHNTVSTPSHPLY